MTISWYALQNYSAGPSEYAQNHSTNPARLRVSGSTPNIGHGPLEVRGANSAGLRSFICGPDTFAATQGQTNFTCPNGYQAKQILYQRIYHKNGSAMSFTDQRTGTMTYHPNHGHYHVDDWTTMTLRLQDPNEPHPLNWPIVATGGKVGFCLMDYNNCWDGSVNGHCRTQQQYQQGAAMNTTGHFPNYGMYGSYSCDPTVQGISVGRTDIYYEDLQGMWINMMPNLCNGNYWIVLEVDPRNVFREENEENNWTAIPFTLTQQRTSGAGGSANINASGRTVLAPGGSVTLTASPGTAYLWSTGATSRSITVSSAGNYSCTVTTPCGQLSAGTVPVTILTAPEAPTGSGATIDGPGTAVLSATGSGELTWYDAASGGNVLGQGGTFSTPDLSSTTPFWVSARSTLAETNVTAGKAYVAAHGSVLNQRQWMYFNATEPFVLRSVKVFSTVVGLRHIVLSDQVGNLIQEKFVEIPAGEVTIDVNFNVPKGQQHRLTAYDDGAVSSSTQLVFQNLHCSTSNVNYPYAIGTVGSITGSSGGASTYYFFYDWKVQQRAVTAESGRTQVVAEVAEGVVVDVKALLEGPYNVQTGLMGDALRLQGVIPTSEPFTASGFTHAGQGGGEVLDPSLLAISGNNAIVDWVLVELRDASQPAQIVATKSALLRRSGQVIAATGEALRFPVEHGNYHVAIRHRNHLGIMTADPLALSHVPALVDLSAPGTVTWGTGARKQLGSVMLMYCGNVVRDAQLKYTGESNDRDPILQAVGGVVPTSTTAGYHTMDSNLDGVVKYTGESNDRDPILQNIGGVAPTSVRFEQIP